MLLVLMVSVDTAAFNCSEKVRETPPIEAVKVAVCAVLTAEMVAENCALVAPATTVTEPGTRTAVALLERATVTPPLGAAAFNVTVHVSLPEPVMDALVHERALIATWLVFNCNVKDAEVPSSSAVIAAV